MDARERKRWQELAERVAREAAPLVVEAFARPRGGEEHKGRIDLVTETDRAVEERVRALLLSESPFVVQGEEEGLSGEGDGVWRWVVDPIDGTTNFAHRVPHLATSIGLWGPSGAVLGVILNPVTGELFSTDGEEVTLGGRRLPPLGSRPLSESLLATGFPYDRQTNADNNVAEADALLMRCRGIRRFGAAALDLAWLAAGRIDGFWEPGLQPWDVVAGLSMVRAVGGVGVTYGGEPWSPGARTLVAGHPAMVEALRGEIAGARRAAGHGAG